MPYRSIVAALAVLVSACQGCSGHTATPAAEAQVLIVRWTPDGVRAADDLHSSFPEDYVAYQRNLILSAEIATRAARSKRLQGLPAVAGKDGAFAIVQTLKVERLEGIKDALKVTVEGVTPEVGVAILEAVLESYGDFLRETYKVPQPGQPSRGGFAMAVLAKPAPVKK